MNDDEQTPIDLGPKTIAPLTLPSGGKVTFRSPDVLTGRDLRYLRAARDQEGMGTFYNVLSQRAMELLVETWDIPDRPTLRTPQYDKAAPDKLSAGDLRALERHLQQPVLDLVRDDEPDDGAPGSPPRPASA
jgi:hypothetical protein